MPATNPVRVHPRPLVALVGRTNVGKSSLWNRLTETASALISSQAHTTRDRRYGTVLWRGGAFDIIDTGGMDVESDVIGQGIYEQSQLALKECDMIVFVIDGKTGPLPEDRQLFAQARKLNKPLWLAVNKIDTMRDLPLAQEPEVFQLTSDHILPLSAHTGFQVGDALDIIVEELGKLGKPPIPEHEIKPLRIAIVGRPNVGKSSIVNSILQQDRVIVSPIAHTTREPQDTLMTYEGRDVILVDTAGIRRKQSSQSRTDLQSIQRNMEAIDDCDVACLVFDVTQDPTAHDRHLAGILKETNKGLILVANKWDLVEQKDTNTNKKTEALVRQLFPFLNWAPMVFVSATKNQRTRTLLDMAFAVQDERHRRIDYNAGNRILKACIKAMKPLAAYGPKSPRIYDVAQVAEAPPKFIVTVIGEKESLHQNWLKFFEKKLREKFGFVGTPIRVQAENMPVSKSSREGRLHGPGYEAAVGAIKEPAPVVNQTRRRQKWR